MKWQLWNRDAALPRSLLGLLSALHDDSMRILFGIPLMHKRIVRAIEAQLEASGLTKTEDEPDVYVLYHVALSQDRRIHVDDFGYSSRWRRPGYGGGDVTVFDVNVGTLIVDMLDAGSEEAVWRGMAQKDLPPTPDPDKMEKKLGKILGKMFRDYPPE